MTRLYLGRRELGKTTLAYHQASTHVERRIIFDPRGLIHQRGAAITHTIGDFQQAIDAMADGDVNEVVYSKPVEPLKRVAFPAFTREAKSWIVGRPTMPVAILIDELASVSEKTSLDEDLEWIIKTTRRSEIDVYLTCHRPSDVPTGIRAVSDYWYIFHTTQEHDLSVIEKRCGTATAALVQGLGPREFVLWNDIDTKVSEYRDPADWFVELDEAGSIEWSAASA